MDIGPGLRPKEQKLRDPGPGPSSFWALILGPVPVSIMAGHMCAKGNQYAINMQYTISDIYITGIILILAIHKYIYIYIHITSYMAYCLLAYCSLLIAYWLLPIAYCPVSVIV